MIQPASGRGLVQFKIRSQFVNVKRIACCHDKVSAHELRMADDSLLTISQLRSLKLLTPDTFAISHCGADRM